MKNMRVLGCASATDTLNVVAKLTHTIRDSRSCESLYFVDHIRYQLDRGAIEVAMAIVLVNTGY
jgi:hypothetical protein